MDYSKIILMAMLAGGFTYLCTTLGSALVFFIKAFSIFEDIELFNYIRMHRHRHLIFFIISREKIIYVHQLPTLIWF